MKKQYFTIIFLFLFLITSFVGAEGTKVDLTALTKETQKMSQSASDLTLIWWIPAEYWKIALSQNSAVSQDQINVFIKTLSPYTVIVAVDGKIGIGGAMSYTAESDLRGSLKLKDKIGKEYTPLTDDKIDAQAKAILGTMEPIFQNMLGEMGKNMHIVLFPANDDAGQPIANANNTGNFSISLGSKSFTWELPLSSLMATKICPTCKKELNGTFKYCPWDGTKI